MSKYKGGMPRDDFRAKMRKLAARDATSMKSADIPLSPETEMPEPDEIFVSQEEEDLIYMEEEDPFVTIQTELAQRTNSSAVRVVPNTMVNGVQGSTTCGDQCVFNQILTEIRALRADQIELRAEIAGATLSNRHLEVATTVLSERIFKLESVVGGGLAKKKNNPVGEIVVTDSEADEADEMSLMSAAECKLESPVVGGGAKKKNTPRRERDFLSLGSLACKFPLNSIEDVEHILELIKQPDRLEELQNDTFEVPQSEKVRQALFLSYFGDGALAHYSMTGTKGKHRRVAECPIMKALQYQWTTKKFSSLTFIEFVADQIKRQRDRSRVYLRRTGGNGE